MNILIYWAISVAILLLLWMAAKGRLINLWLFLGVVVDALKDVACQFWIDVSRLWTRKKTISLDEHEKHLS